jgi:membrane protease YdiL (CAAX protease family)
VLKVTLPTIRYAAESALIVAVIILLSYLSGNRLFELIEDGTERVVPMQVTVTFPVNYIHPSAKLPLVKTQVPPSVMFTAATCDYAKQLSKKEQNYFDKKASASDTILRCTFKAKPKYYETIGSVNGKYMPELMYIYIHILPEINKKPLEQQNIENHIQEGPYYLPYTKIPVHKVPIWLNTLIHLLGSLGLMLCMGYKFSEEKQKIKLGMKNTWVVLLVSSVPMILLSVQLWARRHIGDLQLPAFNLVGPSVSTLQTLPYSFSEDILRTLLNSFSEEAFYRGWIIPMLALRFKPAWCVLISSLIFAYSHNYDVLPSTFVFINGVCWAIIWLKTRSVFLCFVPHVLHNLILILMDYLKQ